MAERTEREVLHHLIEICRDGERGFRTAADHVGAPVLKTLFADLAAQRKQFAEELSPHLHRLGGLPDDGTNAGTFHRGWMRLRGLVPGGHDHAIVSEAERGEHAALNAYKEALNGMLPPTVTDLVEMQRDAIHAANERIRTVDMGYE
ncbi:MAG: ferritin-like domain-containing protein [Vicinamibacterales bacterium]